MSDKILTMLVNKALGASHRYSLADAQERALVTKAVVDALLRVYAPPERSAEPAPPAAPATLLPAELTGDDAIPFEGWTVPMVAKYLGVSLSSARNLAAQGTFRAYRFKSTWRINADDVRAYREGAV